MVALVVGPLAALAVTGVSWLFINSMIWGMHHYGPFGIVAVFFAWLFTGCIICAGRAVNSRKN